MISLRLIFSLCVAAIAASPFTFAASAPLSAVGGKTSAEAAARAAKVSERIAQRIDALLGQRLKPETLPRNPPNPFIMNGVAAVQRGDAVDPEPSPGEAEKAAADRQAEERAAFSDAELLARYVAGLKLGGMITLNDQPRIVINDIPRREGDTIAVKYDGAEVRIQMIRIQPGTITFRFNEAEQTIKY
jgi:hypothetical protein